MEERRDNAIEQLDIPEGRTTSFVLLVLAISLEIVLVATYWLTEGKRQTEDSIAYVNAYEICLLFISFISMAIFIHNSRKAEQLHVGRTNRSTSISLGMDNQNTLTHRAPAFRTMIYIGFGLGSVVNAVFQCIKLAHCVQYQIYFQSVLHVVVNSMQILFCLFQVIFLVMFKTSKCQNQCMRHLLAFNIAANVTLCVKSLVDVVGVPLSEELSKSSNVSPVNADGNRTTCDSSTSDIDDIIEYTYTYFYSFVTEYCILSVSVLVVMWNISVKNNVNYCVDELATDINFGDVSSSNEQTPLLGSGSTPSNRCRVLVATIKFISRYSIWFSLVICLSILISHISLVIDDSKPSGIINTTTNASSNGNGTSDQTAYEAAISVVQTIYMYILSIVALIGYLLGRKEKVKYGNYGRDEMVLFFSAFGHLVLTIFESIAVISDVSKYKKTTAFIEKDVWLFFFKTVFHYIGLYCQTLLIVKCLKLKPSVPSKNVLLILRGIIVFLGVCNAERWIVNSFLPPAVMEYVKQNTDDILGQHNWWFITRITFPLVTLNRIYSALLCYEIVKEIPRY